MSGMLSVLNSLRDLPDLVDKVRVAATTKSSVVTALRDVVNGMSSVLGKSVSLSGSTPRELAESAVSQYRHYRGSVKAKSNALVKAMNETASDGVTGETLYETADRYVKDPAKFAKRMYYTDVMRNVPNVPVGDPVDITDPSSLLVPFRPNRRVQSANGGTIDVIAANGAMGNAAGAVWSSTGTPTYVVTGPDSAAVGSASSVDLSAISLWTKSNIGKRSFVVHFRLEGGSTGHTDPTANIIIPAGVPSGRLKVFGIRKSVGSLYMQSSDTPLNDYGFTTTTAVIAVSDSDNHDYWTWSAASDNEEYVYSRSVTKATNTSKTITIKLDITAGTDNSIFSTMIEVEYYPVDVRLRDLFNMHVDISANDPIDRALEIINMYNDYVSRKGLATFMTILNNRLGTSYDDELIYPQNWNTAEFDSSSVFLDGWIETYNIFRTMILADHEFQTDYI
jgi:hypothetical protein